MAYTGAHCKAQGPGRAAGQAVQTEGRGKGQQGPDCKPCASRLCTWGDQGKQASVLQRATAAKQLQAVKASPTASTSGASGLWEASPLPSSSHSRSKLIVRLWLLR